MRYDSESGKIQITLTELISIARRGISPTVPYDEDEPWVESPVQRRLASIEPDLTPATVRFGFEDGEYSFEMSLAAESIEGNNVTIAREIGSSPMKPKKEDEKQVRGEGYVIAHALATIESYKEINLRIIYLNSMTGEINSVSERVTSARLSTFFNKCKKTVGKYAYPEIHRATVRVPSMKEMKFPYERMRDGQDEFIRGAYRALARGTSLYAAAPTGTGKTVSVLYPAIKAIGNGKCEKIFYLTPKSTTAEAVKDCLALMGESGVSVRGVVLTSKEKACVNSLLCKRSRDGCKMAQFNSLADAALDLFRMNKPMITVDDARDVSRKFCICPHELLLTYAELCDLVVCDFNHAFDPRAYIRRFFDRGGKYAVLVDEAHNLVDRSREMFSVEMGEEDIRAPFESDNIPELSAIRSVARDGSRVFREIMLPMVKDELRRDKDDDMVGAVSLSDVPDRLYSLMDELTDAAEGEYYRLMRAKDGASDQARGEIRNYYYMLKGFRDTLASFDSYYKMFIFYEKGATRVKLFCMDSGPLIKKTIDKCHGAVFFSATLSPLDYYRAVLGGERSDEMLEVESPFDPSQLSVSIVNTISTRISERDDTLGAICRVIAATLSAKRGHYMIFSPSFHYSEIISTAFKARYPKIKVITQKQNMSEKERSEFINCFKEEIDSYLAAFCVMGGIYSEGLDLAGDSLIGAVIVGIGMPSLSYEREAIAEYYEERYEMGKGYAYLYPGMNRVFQAAGRVIRREGDRGVIVMIDDRFSDPIYKKSMPKLWSGVKYIGDAKVLRTNLDGFWAEKNEEK